MGDGPLVVDLAAAEGGSPAHVYALAVGFYADDAVEAVAEGEAVAGFDLEVSDLETERALERVEPISQSLTQHIGAFVFERIDYVER